MCICRTVGEGCKVKKETKKWLVGWKWLKDMNILGLASSRLWTVKIGGGRLQVLQADPDLP